MSSWIVDKAVIDLLVEAFFRHEIVTNTPQTPDSLGTLLWKANYKGVNYRYNEKRRVPRYTHGREQETRQDHYDGTSAPCASIRTMARDGLMVFMQLRCFNYQSCDHPGYESSTAYAYMLSLEHAVLGSLGLTAEAAYAAIDRDRAAYPWGIQY